MNKKRRRRTKKNPSIKKSWLTWVAITLGLAVGISAFAKSTASEKGEVN